MNRSENAGAHQKRTDQAERERQNGEQDGPAGKSLTLFCHDSGMEQCRAQQPGHERGVFNGIPEPPATPAKLIIGPEGAQRDSTCERNPCRQNPGPHPARPCGISPAFQQCRYGEAECHGKAYIAEVKQRRMEDEAGILQQRIQFGSIQRGRKQPLKGVGREQGKGKERNADHRLDREYPSLQAGAKIVPKTGDAGAEYGKDQDPEQHRAFMIAPSRGKSIRQRLAQCGMLGHQLHGEIRLAEAGHEDAEGKRDEQRLQLCRRAAEGHERAIATHSAQHWQHRLGGSREQGEDQGKMPDFGQHDAQCPPNAKRLNERSFKVTLADRAPDGRVHISRRGCWGAH